MIISVGLDLAGAGEHKVKCLDERAKICNRFFAAVGNPEHFESKAPFTNYFGIESEPINRRSLKPKAEE